MAMPEDRGASGSSLRRAVDGELLEAENPLDYLVLLALEAKRYDGHWDGDDAQAARWVVAQWCQEIGYVPDLRAFETGQQVPRGQEPDSYEPAFYGQPVADGGNPHWQQCEIPDCTNEVPTSKAICDDHAGGGPPVTDGGQEDGDADD